MGNPKSKLIIADYRLVSSNFKTMSEIPRSEQSEKEPEIKIAEYSDEEHKDQVKELIFEVYE